MILARVTQFTAYNKQTGSAKKTKKKEPKIRFSQVNNLLTAKTTAIVSIPGLSTQEPVSLSMYKETAIHWMDPKKQKKKFIVVASQYTLMVAA